MNTQKLTSIFTATAAALALSATVASAQMRGTGTVSLSNQRPAAGSEQAELLAPHMDFINKMGCCTDRDGRAMLEEIDQSDTNPSVPYVVMRRETVDGLQLSEPVAIPIPASKVRDLEDYESRCASTIARAEASGTEHTCTPPPYNVIWAYDNIRYDSSRGVYTNTDDRTKEYEPGSVIPAEDYRVTNLYCYFPEPQF